jgi:hypothetical protein
MIIPELSSPIICVHQASINSENSGWIGDIPSKKSVFETLVCVLNHIDEMRLFLLILDASTNHFMQDWRSGIIRVWCDGIITWRLVGWIIV